MHTIYLRTWKFALEGRDGLETRRGLASEPWAPSFDDSGWRQVILPHDWAVALPFSREWSSGTGYLPGGTGWYRTAFDSSMLSTEIYSSVLGTERDAPRGGSSEGSWRASIAFEGAYKNAQVWVNGSYLGRRPNGYIGFSYDITHCLKAGRNVVAVKLSHEDIADSRWYTGSGLYRGVYIDLHDALFVEPESLVVRTQVPGEAADTPSGAALVAVSGKAVNKGSSAAEGASVRAVLEGEEGERLVAESPLSPIAAGDSLGFELRIPVPGARLWSSVSPNLYSLTVELRCDCGGRKARFASKSIRVGLRSIRFDPDSGFFVNGVGEKLKGVCVHHDSGCLGAAFWPDVWRRRLEKLKAMGCNALRFSHNPQAPELYDLCDELGFYVMDEAFDEWEGCKNKWYRGHNVYPPVHQGYYEDFPQWHERDLAALIIRDRNHPSVVAWSIGNEIDYPNDPYVHPLFAQMAGNNDANKPAEEQRYDPDKPNMGRIATIAAELVGIVKSCDATRPVLAAAAFPELSSRLGFFDSLDMVGYNYKEGLYDADHERFPRLPIIGSENGHSYEAWLAARDKAFIAGQFLWTGIDFLGEARGWPVRCSGAGLLDTAGNEKPGYYRRKTLWKSESALYLATCLAPEAGGGQPREIQPWELERSWDYGRGDEVAVICYTSLDSAELFLNGRSLGSKRRDSTVEYIAWQVPFERGRLEVRGIGAEQKLCDAIESTLPASRLALEAWRPSRPSAGRPHPAEEPSPFRMAQIELEVQDEAGRLCARQTPLIEVSVSKGARLLGLENGDIADCSEYCAPWRRAYRGRLIAYALIMTEASEPQWLEASIEGLQKARIEL